MRYISEAGWRNCFAQNTRGISDPLTRMMRKYRASIYHRWPHCYADLPRPKPGVSINEFFEKKAPT